MEKLPVLLLAAVLGLAWVGVAIAHDDRNPTGIADDYFAGKITKEDAIADLTKEANNQEHTAKYRAWALFNRGNIRRASGESTLARADVKEAITTNPDTVGGYRVLSYIYINERKFKKAIKAIEEASKNCVKCQDCTDEILQELKAQYVALDSALDATAFQEEFRENLFAAEEKYSGKEIIISGKVSNIGRTIYGPHNLRQARDCPLYGSSQRDRM